MFYQRSLSLPFMQSWPNHELRHPFSLQDLPQSPSQQATMLLQPYLSEAAAEPCKVKAPVAHYDPFTRVEGDIEHSFPSVPLQEPALVTILLPKVTDRINRLYHPLMIKLLPASQTGLTSVQFRQWRP